MKSLEELFTDLAETLHYLNRWDDLESVEYTDKVMKAQQLLGYIRRKLKEEQWKPQ